MMCIDACGRVVERSGDEVVVETGQLRRRASTLLAPETALEV